MLIRVEPSVRRILVTLLQIALVVSGFYSFLSLTNVDVMQSPNSLDPSSPSYWKAIRQMEIDYWKNIRVETMTPQQILDYFRWSNHTACDVYNYFGGKIYFMNPTAVDGQYPVCLDPLVKPRDDKCLVYSFGINDNWSFDEMMAWYGCQVFSFDPSIKKLDHDHSEDVHFYNLGLGFEDVTVDSNGWPIKTLDSIYRMLLPRHGEKIIDYLKMDIEWHEWKALQQIIDSGMLSKVRQLSVEFHLPHQDIDPIWPQGTNMSMTIQDYRSLVGLVKSIEKRMIRFAARGTLWCDRRIKILDNYFGNVCIEMSFYQILPYA